MHCHLQPVLGQGAAGALHRGHRDAHRTGDVAILHATLRVVLIGAQQYLCPLPFTHRCLARCDERFEFLSFFNTEFDPVFFVGHAHSTLATHQSRWLRPLGRVKSDPFQLPGAFLIHHRQVIKAYAYRDAADKPDYVTLATPDRPSSTSAA